MQSLIIFFFFLSPFRDGFVILCMTANRTVNAIILVQEGLEDFFVERMILNVNFYSPVFS